jgi:hypothetical protein
VSITLSGRDAATFSTLGTTATSAIRVVRNALLSKDSTDKNVCACAAVYTAVHSATEKFLDDDEREAHDDESETMPPRKRRGAEDLSGDGARSSKRKGDSSGSGEQDEREPRKSETRAPRKPYGDSSSSANVPEPESRPYEPPARPYVPERRMPR